MFKVIIAGSRYFTDRELLFSKCDNILSRTDNVTIISGGANGADYLGEEYAKSKGHLLEIYPANWSLGRKAGPIRNEKMAKNADALILFWNGESKGSANMLMNAKKQGLKVREVKIVL